MANFRVWIDDISDYSDLMVFLHVLNVIVRAFWNVNGVLERHSFDRVTNTYNVLITVPESEFNGAESFMRYTDKHTAFAPNVYWERV